MDKAMMERELNSAIDAAHEAYGYAEDALSALQAGNTEAARDAIASLCDTADNLVCAANSADDYAFEVEDDDVADD